MSRKKYRRILIFILILNTIAIGLFFYFGVIQKIPEDIKILVNHEEEFDFGLPIDADIEAEALGVIQTNSSNVPAEQLRVSFSSPFKIRSSQIGSYKVNLKLFGFLTVKEISLDVLDSIEIIPGGAPIGIIMETNGILVLGTSPVAAEDGMNYEPAINILKSGDYITAVNGTAITEKEKLIDIIQKEAGKSVKLTVRRMDQIETVEVTPVKAPDGSYKIGTWIRDDTQGIGTLTFLTSTGDFGALGHAIVDIDTSVLIQLGSGEIFTSEIVAITKGSSGTPGELSGIIHQSNKNKIGNLFKNTNQGIFGKTTINWQQASDLLSLSHTKPVSIAFRQDVKLGPAIILCSIDGEVKEYDIMIESIDLSNSKHSKGLVISITDEELIAKTGGIVQGMSGSPILQDGKLIGAVTHVFIRDSKKGYGTFIENMLEMIPSNE